MSLPSTRWLPSTVPSAFLVSDRQKIKGLRRANHSLDDTAVVGVRIVTSHVTSGNKTSLEATILLDVEDKVAFDLGETLGNASFGGETEGLEAVKVVYLVKLLANCGSPTLVRPVLLELHSLSMAAWNLDAILDALASPLGTTFGLHNQSVGLLGILNVGTKTLPTWSIEQIIVLCILGKV